MLSKTGIIFTMIVFYACLGFFLSSFPLKGFNSPNIYTLTPYIPNATVEIYNNPLAHSATLYGTTTMTCAEVKTKGWVWKNILYPEALDACGISSTTFSLENVVDNIEGLGWINAVVFAPLIIIFGWIILSTFFPTGSGGA